MASSAPDLSLSSGMSGDPLECPICLETFQDPRILPCFHTLCGSCLDRHIQKARDEAQDVFCPVCRSQLHPDPQLGAKQFQANFYVEALKTERRAALAINASPSKMGFPLPESVELQLGELNGEKNDDRPCFHDPVHSGSLFCCQCVQPTCEPCSEVFHNDHQVVKSDMTAIETRNKLAELRSRISKTCRFLDSVKLDCRSYTNKVHADIGSIKVKMEDERKKAHDLINAMFEERAQNLHNWQDEEVEKAAVLSHEADAILSKLDKLEESTEEAQGQDVYTAATTQNHVERDVTLITQKLPQPLADKKKFVLMPPDKPLTETLSDCSIFASAAYIIYHPTDNSGENQSCENDIDGITRNRDNELSINFSSSNSYVFAHENKVYDKGHLMVRHLKETEQIENNQMKNVSDNKGAMLDTGMNSYMDGEKDQERVSINPPSACSGQAEGRKVFHCGKTDKDENEEQDGQDSIFNIVMKYWTSSADKKTEEPNEQSVSNGERNASPERNRSASACSGQAEGRKVFHFGKTDKDENEEQDGQDSIFNIVMNYRTSNADKKTEEPNEQSVSNRERNASPERNRTAGLDSGDTPAVIEHQAGTQPKQTAVVYRRDHLLSTNTDDMEEEAAYVLLDQADYEPAPDPKETAKEEHFQTTLDGLVLLANECRTIISDAISTPWKDVSNDVKDRAANLNKSELNSSMTHLEGACAMPDLTESPPLSNLAPSLLHSFVEKSGVEQLVACDHDQVLVNFWDDDPDVYLKNVAGDVVETFRTTKDGRDIVVLPSGDLLFACPSQKSLQHMSRSVPQLKITFIQLDFSPLVLAASSHWLAAAGRTKVAIFLVDNARQAQVFSREDLDDFELPRAAAFATMNGRPTLAVCSYRYTYPGRVFFFQADPDSSDSSTAAFRHKLTFRGEGVDRGRSPHLQFEPRSVSGCPGFFAVADLTSDSIVVLGCELTVVRVFNLWNDLGLASPVSLDFAESDLEAWRIWVHCSVESNSSVAMLQLPW